MSKPRITPQDFQPTQRPKRKRSYLQPPNGATTSFYSPNKFAVLSDSEQEEDEGTAPPTPQEKKPRIPPIVVYSLFNNHTTTLQQVNEKLTTPVEVKTKADRLLLYTKSTTDYSTLLSEIKSANVAYHTYPLPETTQPRLVLKGIPPNVSETEILTELNKLNVQVIWVTQITKIDKVTRNILTKYPIFVITFAPGTDVHNIIHINKLCHCFVKWEKFKNSRPVKQCFNCQSFGHSSNYCGRPP